MKVNGVKKVVVWPERLDVTVVNDRGVDVTVKFTRDSKVNKSVFDLADEFAKSLESYVEAQLG